MGSFLRDLRYGLRTMLSSPGFTLVAVLTMAIGIAANTTVFSWIDSVLLNPFPGAGDPDRIVALETSAPSGEPLLTSYPDYRDFRDRVTLLDGLSVSQPRPVSIGVGTRADRVWLEMVSGNYFDVMRVKPRLGRFFVGSERDDAPGGKPVAVLSSTLWKNRFHSDPAVLGRTIHINRYPYTIIGVAPEDFHGAETGLAYELWAPAMMYGQLSAAGDYFLRDRKTRMFFGQARLKPGVTVEQARAELKSIARTVAEANADTNTGISATLLPMWQSDFSAQHVLLAPLGILMGVCTLVLLIACANVANLLLARATARDREFSIRLALGAPRGRLVRQLLTESLLLASAGSFLGLILAVWLRGSLKWLMPASSSPTVLEPTLNTGVFAFTVALAVVVAALAGLAPALHAARTNVDDALKEGGRSGLGSARAHRLRGALVITEVSLAVVALVGAGLFLKSFETARSLNPGFDPHNVVIGSFHLSTAGYNSEQATSFCRRLRERLEATPGIQAVSYADSVPLGFIGGAWEDLEIKGYVPSPSENMKIDRNLVAPGYFSLMRIPLLEGRDFDDHDDEKSLPVMIVNQEFLRRFLPDQNPIGRQVHGWGKWFTIVGVVKDSKYHNITEPQKPYFYIPIRQIFRPEFPTTFHVRATVPPDQALAILRREAQAVDPAVALFDAMPLNEYISQSLFGQKVAASLLSVLGIVALLLASIGLYSVMAYSISQRTQEIGIRMALGAQPLDVLRMAVAQGMLFALTGLAIGTVAAAALARLASAALIAVSPADPTIYLSVAAFLILLSFLATWLPARRATRVEPMLALRYQ
jgi:predicted permease